MNRNYWNAMSFPPHRPPLGMPPLHPGLIQQGFAMPPMGAPMMPISIGLMPGGPMMPPGVPMPMPDARGPPPTYKRKPIYHFNSPLPPKLSFKNEDKSDDSNKAPTTTVFVGNISERASDNMVKLMLNRCGNVVSWKRVQGASGKLQAFGFCEFADPESSLRAIRLLHDYLVADKKLVVKVDAKTKAQLDEYKAVKRAKLGSTDANKESKENAEEELDEQTQKEDKIVKGALDAIVRDHEQEMNQPPQEEEDEPKMYMPYISRYNPPVNTEKERHEKKLSKTQEALLKLSKTGDKENEKSTRNNDLDGMELEEDKKNLISREIRSFRETYQGTTRATTKDYDSDEETREKDNKDRRERDRERHRERIQKDKEREKERNKEKDRRKDRERSREISRAHSREKSRDRTRSRSREQSSDRDRSRSREREKKMERERDREAEREREREEEEEAYDRKKMERKLREKEAAYQEHLRSWEIHEKKKIREHNREREKEDERRSEELKEAKRLKEFLEDYDDERDDPKYYKGSALSRRMKEREKEIDIDNRDRQREKEEIEEIRQRLLAEGHPDPNAEVARLEKEREQHMQPRLKIIEIVVEEKKPTMRPISALPVLSIHNSPQSEEDSRSAISLPQKRLAEDDSTQNSFSSVSELLTPKDEPKAKPLGFTGLKLGSSKSPTQESNSKRKKLILGDVFNTNEDEDSSDSSTVRKRKLVPLEYTEEEMKAVGQHSTTAEEKRRSIKSLIDKIPTAKDELFAYVIDWTIVDNNLMERRIKPWINKKIVEYIGEEEATLVDFICSKVMARSSPKSILEDVSMVLDEEAEVFVVKMWRLLIYEIEAKKAGLVK